MYCNVGLNTVEIGQALGFSNSCVGRFLERNGIPRTHTPNELKLSAEEREEICRRYINGETSIELGSAYGVCDKSITNILKQNNIGIREAKRRSKVKNHDYFEVIDSIDKAYFLGWMITDGSVVEHKTRHNRAKNISLEIQKKDVHILCMFAKVLGAEDDIVRFSRTRNTCYMRFASNKMANDLEKYGVVPRKTYTAYLPLIREDLMPHMIRGIFDGNGTVTVDKGHYGYLRFAFYGTKKICGDINEYLHNTIGLNLNKVSKSTCYHVWWGGVVPPKKFSEFIYANCGEYYLKRKRKKFSTFN